MRGERILLLLLYHIVCTEAKDTVKLLFGGDITFGRVTRYLVEKGNCTYNESFEKLKPYLQDSDYVIANLETTLEWHDAKDLELDDTILHLISQPSSLSALKYAGINDVSVANNHIHDGGEKGINKTLRLLKENNIRYFGMTYGKHFDMPQKPLIFQRNGIKICMLAYCRTGDYMEDRLKYNLGAARINISMVMDEVKDLRKSGCHVVVVYMHWGTEYRVTPDLYIDKMLLELVKNSSIDLIVGSHPHVTHQHFYANKTLVATSLGNLLFPSHYAWDLGFNLESQNISIHDKYLEKMAEMWYKQSRLAKNDPTTFGKLLKIEVNKNGIIPSKTKYLQTHIFPTKKHCLVVDKKKNTSWRVVCGKGDPECIGHNHCNMLYCNNVFKDQLRLKKTGR